MGSNDRECLLDGSIESWCMKLNSHFVSSHAIDAFGVFEVCDRIDRALVLCRVMPER
jgi:hypothetical protein